MISLQNNDCLVTMVGHLNAVRCIAYVIDPGLIASGSVDYTIKVLIEILFILF